MSNKTIKSLADIAGRVKNNAIINFTSGRKFTKSALFCMGFNNAARWAKRERLEASYKPKFWYNYATPIPQGVDFDTWRFYNRQEAVRCDHIAAEAVAHNARVALRIERLVKKDGNTPMSISVVMGERAFHAQRR